MIKTLSKTNLKFALFSAAVVLFFRHSLHALAAFAYSSDLYFYILLVPLVSGYFIYTRREKSFSDAGPSYSAGVLIIASGCALLLAGGKWGTKSTSDDVLCLTTASILLIWAGGFLFFYGVRTFKHLAFPICFLFLMIPLPSALSGQLIVILQKGSADVTYWIIKAAGIPVTRHGFIFSLSHIEFSVAPECSGIRSGLYLLLTGLVFSQLFLKSPLSRTLLVFAVLPIAIFKNGLRIVTITLLANYVNKDILFSDLHRKGGIPFMILGVAILFVIAKLLERTQKHSLSSQSPGSRKRYAAEAGSL
jgi:exosortase